jgi:hypothetical protein
MRRIDVAETTFTAPESTARHPATGARGVFDPVYGYGIVDAEAAVAYPGAAAKKTKRGGGTG